MTVCIAGLAGLSFGRRILLCSDTRLETDSAGGDGASKLHGAGGGFVAMIAGEYSSALDLVRIIRKHFDGRSELEPDEVADELSHSASIQKRRIADNFVRSRFAINYQEFLDRSADWLPADIRQRVFFDVEQLGLRCELIVAGFPKNEPCIFTVGSDCSVHQADTFACIGTGASIAQSALFQRGFHQGIGICEAAYCLYEAKKLSEIAPGVGDATHFRVMEQAGLFPLPSEGLEYLERQYKEFGLKPFREGPDSLKDLLGRDAPQAAQASRKSPKGDR